MCCDIYCYKISSLNEQTANSPENFWWEQKPGKTQLPRFCFDYCIRGSLLFYPARKLLMCLALWCSHHDSSYCCSCQSHLARVNSNTAQRNTPPTCWCWDLPGVFSLPGECVCGTQGMFFHPPHPRLAPTLPSARARLGWAGLVLALATATEICPVARWSLQGLKTESKDLRKQKAQALHHRTTIPWL